jgi:hypothetical protein
VQHISIAFALTLQGKNPKNKKMNNLFRGLLSGYGAFKLGGGCLGTVVMFIIIWALLGKCN